MPVKTLGTQLQSSTSSTGHVSVGTLVGFGYPRATASKIETAPDANGWKTFISGIKEGGSVNVVLEYGATGHAALLALLGTPENFKIIVPPVASGKGFQFDGFISGLGADGEQDGIIRQQIELTVSGEVKAI